MEATAKVQKNPRRVTSQSERVTSQSERVKQKTLENLPVSNELSTDESGALRRASSDQIQTSNKSDKQTVSNKHIYIIGGGIIIFGISAYIYSQLLHKEIKAVVKPIKADAKPIKTDNKPIKIDDISIKTDGKKTTKPDRKF